VERGANHARPHDDPYARHIGFIAYLFAGQICISCLRAFELPDALQAALAAFACDAMHMLSLPHNEAGGISVESNLVLEANKLLEVERGQQIKPQYRAQLPAGSRHGTRCCAAACCVTAGETSWTAQRRHAPWKRGSLPQRRPWRRNSCATARWRRRAANRTELHARHFKLCARCRVMVYCSKAHQVEDWPRHKAACTTTRAAEEHDDRTDNLAST
jgi:hypothetical protein